MIDIDTLKKEIVSRLEPLKPEKVILFGSYAYGNPTEDSDIDLYVVTNDDFMPKSFKEKMDVVLKVSSAILDIRQKYSTDLIVHTKPMHEKFVELNSSFCREIMNNGLVFYE